MAELSLDDSLFTEARQRLAQAAACERRAGVIGAGDEDASGMSTSGAVVTAQPGSLARWRNKDRIKTQAAVLILCLNIGVDPPDVTRVSPCNRLECWVHPDATVGNRNAGSIAKVLQSQYERWQPRARYRVQHDPTADDVKRLCREARRHSRNERVLFHYNGHGVPAPTANGEVWVFNKTFTQYIPVSVHDLVAWLGQPAIYVLDCSHAGLIVSALRAAVASGAGATSGAGGHGGAYARDSASLLGSLAARGALHGPSGAGAGGGRGVAAGVWQPGVAPGRSAGGAADASHELIALAACGADEVLPQDSDLCADIFTACLTTPIRVAMRWCASKSMLVKDATLRERIDRIPGRQTDRKTLLGELNWIFTSVTDTIAWNVLPRDLFQRLFRQDLLLASLFRNYMLAERILKSLGAAPLSWPRLPPLHQHPLWDAWDVAAEAALLQLPAVVVDESRFVPSTFFAEQLTSFELWLSHSAGGLTRPPPQQLPIVLQVLLSQVHRMRALKLLGRFLDKGAECVELALSVGIFPYVLKLLQTTLPDLRRHLVFIWCKILATDAGCHHDIVKENGHPYFITVLQAALPPAGGSGSSAAPPGAPSLATLAQAMFVLAKLCSGSATGQQRCFEAAPPLLPALVAHAERAFAATQVRAAEGGPNWKAAAAEHALLLKWGLLCLGALCSDFPAAVAAAVADFGVYELLKDIIAVSYDAEARAAAVFALGCMVHSGMSGAPTSSGGVVSGGATPEAAPAATGVLSPGTFVEAPAARAARLDLERSILAHAHDLAREASMLIRVEVTLVVARAACVPPVTAAAKPHVVDFADAFDRRKAAVLESYEAVAASGPDGGGGAGAGGGVRASTGHQWVAGGDGGGRGALVHFSETLHCMRGTHSEGVEAVGRRRPGPGDSPHDVRGAVLAGDSGASTAAEYLVNRISSSAAPSQRRHSEEDERSKAGAGCESSAAARGGASHTGALAAASPRSASSGSTNVPPAAAAAAAAAAAPRARDGAAGAGDVDAAGVGPQGDEAGAAAPATPPRENGASLAPRARSEDVRSSNSSSISRRRRSSSSSGSSSAEGSGYGGGAVRNDSPFARGYPPDTSALYEQLVMTLELLATDPAPVVAHYARLALNTTGHEIQLLSQPAAPGGLAPLGHQAAGASALHSASSSAAMPLPTAPSIRPAASVANSVCSETSTGSHRGGIGYRLWKTMQGLTPSSHQSNLRQSNLGGAAGGAGASGAVGTQSGAGSPMPLSPRTAQRANAYVITPLSHEAGAASQRSHAAETLQPPDVGSPAHARPGMPAVAAGGAAHPERSGQGGGAILPESLVFKLLCEQFARPMSASAAAATSLGVPAAPRGPHVIERLQGRTEQRVAVLDTLHGRKRMCEAAARPRLREDVQTLKTSAKGTTAIMLHPADDTVTAVDALGFVHVWDTRPDRDAAHAAAPGGGGGCGPTPPAHLNCYHVCSGLGVDPRGAAAAPAPACTILHVASLNGLEWPMLLACAADGAIRIWAQHGIAGEQKLVSAWQSVEINQHSFEVPAAAAFHYSAVTRSVHAVGGFRPNTINVWDLACERCTQQLVQGFQPGECDRPLHTTALTGADLFREGTALAAAGSDGAVRVFDVRVHSGNPALCFAPAGSGVPLTGVAMRPSGIAACATATSLYFCDIRIASASDTTPRSSVFRKEEATRTGRLTALCAHAHAPLFATGSGTQVVKIWNEGGDVVSSIRARQQPPLLRMGRTTCMAFAPFDLRLATGASDALCSVYSMGGEGLRSERAERSGDDDAAHAATAAAGAAATGGGAASGATS